MLNVIYIVMLIVTAAILIQMTTWSWRDRIVFLKWGCISVSILLTVIIAAEAAVMAVELYRPKARRAPAPDVKIPATPELIRRGQAIADGFCASRHSNAGTLTGGFDIGKKLPIPIGSFLSSNLTPAGPLKHRSDGEISRAIRNGVDANGRWLVVMSLTNAGNLSGDNIQALIAYIRSTLAVGPQAPDPPDDVSPPGLTMQGTGLLPTGKPVFTGAIEAPPTGSSRTDLNLVKEWRRDEFITTMRTGIDPNGHDIDGEEMPWRDIGKMDDVELASLHEFLIHLPGAPTFVANQEKGYALTMASPLLPPERGDNCKTDYWRPRCKQYRRRRTAFHGRRRFYVMAGAQVLGFSVGRSHFRTIAPHLSRGKACRERTHFHESRNLVFEPTKNMAAEPLTGDLIRARSQIPRRNQNTYLVTSPAEIRRLMTPADILRPTTERLLRAARVSKGMQVLDLGCGAGDVSILAAELVGPASRLIGRRRADSWRAQPRQGAGVAVLTIPPAFAIEP